MLQDLVSHTKIHTNIIQKIELVLEINSYDNNNNIEIKICEFKSYRDIYQKVLKSNERGSQIIILHHDLLLNRLTAAVN